MKKLFSLLTLGFFPFLLMAQLTNASLMHDDMERSYNVYVPENYTGENPVPLVLNFHGYGSNAFEQTIYGDFRSIADAEGFIVVQPNGTELEGVTHWNVGGWTLGSQTNDVSFTEALIDQLASDYNINLSRVYATGMSNGGYMSFLLACQLSDKIAAIASVTGAMTPETDLLCAPNHPMPVLQIHGTMDATVPYSGASWTIGIADVMAYWVDFNGTETEAVVTQVPDINMEDGSTVEHAVYTNATTGLTVEHMKVIGGGHTWPGSAIAFGSTNLDIDASREIWDFFARYDLDGLITTQTTDLGAPQKISVYPNPSHSMLRVEHALVKDLTYAIKNILGQTVQSGVLAAGATELNISSLPTNIYFLQMDNQTIKVIKE